MTPRYDFHVHSLFSDGELIPAEIAQRSGVLGYKALAITDHVDNSNMEWILSNLVGACVELNKEIDLELIPGVEVTHVPPAMIPSIIARARALGARVVVVHGETLMEPVAQGTNLAAVEGGADILAHPGLIDLAVVESAKENGVYLELTSRRGHSITNGHVARAAMEVGAKLLVNSDAHGPEDLLPQERALEVALGAGLSPRNSKSVTAVNPKRLLRVL